MIVPLVADAAEAARVAVLGRLAVVASGLQAVEAAKQTVEAVATAEVAVLVDSVAAAVAALDAGAAHAAVPDALLKSAADAVSVERILAAVDFDLSAPAANTVAAAREWVATAVAGVLVTLTGSPSDSSSEAITASLRSIADAATAAQQSSSQSSPKFLAVRTSDSRLFWSPALVRELDSFGFDVIVDSALLPDPKAIGGEQTDDADHTGDDTLTLSSALTACLKRLPDGQLYPTVVSDERGIALGLVYSSKESISEAVRLRRGVYYSRSRKQIWYKGDTSGATQELCHIELDCDRDSLRFVTRQSGVGFCHLNRRSCFGNARGLSLLESTLFARKSTAVAGSYTNRLFSDPQLLRSKILEEAEELCDATEKSDIAWEAADLIYFALVKAVAADVTLEDIEKVLDQRSRKVTRRPGNAKPAKAAVESSVAAPTSTGEQSQSNAASAKPANASSSSSPSSSAASNASSGNGASVREAAVGRSSGDADGKIRMQTFVFDQIDEDKRRALLLRPIIESGEIVNRVRPIVAAVKERGDAALLEFTEKFDRVKLSSPVLRPPYKYAIEDDVRASIDLAFNNIRRFHEAQLDPVPLRVETMPGVVCERHSRPIERVGLYVPGGSAVLPSTALMLGVPALVAGCKTIVIAVPPKSDGTVCPEVLYVAEKVGAIAVVVAGGAQAIAAMAYGTASVPKVDKICGPGNQFVTAAKMLLQSDSSAMISIDMPAGPSELLVIADENCNPAYVASDLLSQAEHGPDSQVVLLAAGVSEAKLEAIHEQVHQQASVLPRVDIVRISIPKSYSLAVASIEQAIEFSNRYAPEHLILHVDNAEKYLKSVQSAGSVFVGKWSPESCGDYASGTNHTLPTYGFARMYSGVSTATFLKYITSQSLTERGLDAIGDAVATLAHLEGLQAHRNAVLVRLKDIRNIDAAK